MLTSRYGRFLCYRRMDPAVTLPNGTAPFAEFRGNRLDARLTRSQLATPIDRSDYSLWTNYSSYFQKIGLVNYRREIVE